MLPSRKRLSVPLFATVLARGTIVHSPLFTARILKAGGESRFSAVVSKKIAKTAVERNKLRRRIYSAVRPLESKIKPGFHMLLLAKPTLPKALLKDIVKDLENFLLKAIF